MFSTRRIGTVITRHVDVCVTSHAADGGKCSLLIIKRKNLRWLSGVMVRASDLRSSGRGFEFGVPVGPLSSYLGQLSLPSLWSRKIEYRPG